MPDRTTIRIRHWMPLIALAALVGTAAPAGAQGIGVGARLAWVRSNVPLEADSVRFVGGQLRLGGGHFGFEIAIDHHSETLEALNQKIVETPIQTSLLLRLATGTLSPYLLGGPGWYRRRVEPVDGPSDLSVSTTEFGWHAGGGTGGPPGATRRHPWGLPLHVPRFQRRQRSGNRRRGDWQAAPRTQGIDVDSRRHRLFLETVQRSNGQLVSASCVNR